MARISSIPIALNMGTSSILKCRIRMKSIMERRLTASIIKAKYSILKRYGHSGNTLNDKSKVLSGYSKLRSQLPPKHSLVKSRAHFLTLILTCSFAGFTMAQYKGNVPLYLVLLPSTKA
jgi:hypothetical protein